MERKRYAIITFIAVILMMGLTTAAWADSDSDSDSDSGSIVGSWEAVSVLDPSGEESPGLFTFNADGTWIASSNEVAFSNAHGAWKQTGSATFTGTSKGFVFGGDGSAILTVTNRVDLTVSSDGESFTADFATEVRQFDGTLIDSFTGTSSGDRIDPH